jgi:hypothetical protein
MKEEPGTEPAQKPAAETANPPDAEGKKGGDSGTSEVAHLVGAHPIAAAIVAGAAAELLGAGAAAVATVRTATAVVSETIRDRRITRRLRARARRLWDASAELPRRVWRQGKARLGGSQRAEAPTPPADTR